MRQSNRRQDTDRRFLLQEVPKDYRTPRYRTVMIFNEKTKTNELKQESYMPEEKQYDVVVNNSGATIRLLTSELKQYGFDKDPYSIDIDADVMIPEDQDIVNVRLDSEEMPRGRS